MARSSRRWLIAGLAALLLAGLALVGSGAFVAYRRDTTSVPSTTSTTPGGQANFDAVPANASAVIAVDLAKVWKSPRGKDIFRELPALTTVSHETFAERFGMPMTALERVTLVVPPPEGKPISSALIAFNTTQPIDWKKITGNLPFKAVGSDPSKPDYYTLGAVEAHPFGDKSVVVIPVQSPATAALSDDVRKAGTESPLERASQALGTHTAILDVSLDRLRKPEATNDLVDESIQSLFAGQRLQLALDLGDELQADARLTYGDGPAAQAGETALRAALARLQTKLNELASQNGSPTDRRKAATALAERLGKAEIRREGAELGLTIALPTDPATTALFYGPDNPIYVLQGNAFRVPRSQNNLKQLVFAVHTYNDAIGRIPGNVLDKSGKPLLSWRVALLPYLGSAEERLHKQFKLDEPWDSPHNKRLLTPTPRVFLLPGQDADAGLTHYLTFTGPGTAFDADGKPTLRSLAGINDGTSNTLFALEAAEGVPWTRPTDLPFTAGGPTPRVGGHFEPHHVNAVFFDGRVRQLGAKSALTPLITVAGGETVDLVD